MISVILPVFKNSVFLEELITRIHRALDSTGFEHEIICVNDCCPESSLIILKKILSYDRRLIVIDLKRNVGQHKAVLTGMAYASGDFIAVMDADLQDPPEYLPRVIAIARENSAIVFAGRKGRYESLMRLFTSKLFKNIFSLIAQVPNDAGMFFVIPEHVKNTILSMRVNKPFVIAMLGAVSISKISYPIERNRRLCGRSGYSSWRRILFGMRAIKCVLQCRYGFSCSAAPDYISYVRLSLGAINKQRG